MKNFFGKGASALTFILGLVMGVVLAKSAPFEVSDWASLIGAALGAIITVIGALMVIDYQANAAARERSKIFLDQIVSIRRWISKVRDPQVGEGESQLFARQANARHLRDAIDKLRETRKFATPDSAALVEAHALIGRIPTGLEVATMYGNQFVPISEKLLDESLREIESMLDLVEMYLKRR